MTRAMLLLTAGLLLGCASTPHEDVRPFRGASFWVLVSGLDYRLGETDVVISVPAGFVTDYASVPPEVCTLIPKLRCYGRPAIVHDYLYWRGECEREQADQLLYLAMAESGVPRNARDTIYRLLRWFGQPGWDRNVEAREEELPRVIPEAYREIPDDESFWTYRERLRDEGVPVDTRSSDPPPYCAAASELFHEARSRERRWWNPWD